MYADDLVLLSISVNDLKLLIDICVKEFNDIGMEINIKKSGCMRVGDQHNVDMSPILISDQSLQWKQEIKYLGIVLTKSKRFQFNFQNSKQKYCRALNGIFEKVGLNTSPIVICSLVESYCVPILLYSAEFCMWSNKMFNSNENAYSHAYMKIFKTFEKRNIEYCQFLFGYLPMTLRLLCKKLQYLSNFAEKKMETSNILATTSNNEFKSLVEKYQLTINHQVPLCYIVTIWNYFKNVVAQNNSTDNCL